MSACIEHDDIAAFVHPPSAIAASGIRTLQSAICCATASCSRQFLGQVTFCVMHVWQMMYMDKLAQDSSGYAAPCSGSSFPGMGYQAPTASNASVTITVSHAAFCSTKAVDGCHDHVVMGLSGVMAEQA